MLRILANQRSQLLVLLLAFFLVVAPSAALRLRGGAEVEKEKEKPPPPPPKPNLVNPYATGPYLMKPSPPQSSFPPQEIFCEGSQCWPWSWRGGVRPPVTGTKPILPPAPPPLPGTPGGPGGPKAIGPPLPIGGSLLPPGIPPPMPPAIFPFPEILPGFPWPIPGGPTSYPFGEGGGGVGPDPFIDHRCPICWCVIDRMIDFVFNKRHGVSIDSFGNPDWAHDLCRQIGFQCEPYLDICRQMSTKENYPRFRAAATGQTNATYECNQMEFCQGTEPFLLFTQISETSLGNTSVTGKPSAAAPGKDLATTTLLATSTEVGARDDDDKDKKNMDSMKRSLRMSQIAQPPDCSSCKCDGCRCAAALAGTKVVKHEALTGKGYTIREIKLSYIQQFKGMIPDANKARDGFAKGFVDMMCRFLNAPPYQDVCHVQDFSVKVVKGLYEEKYSDEICSLMYDNCLLPGSSRPPESRPVFTPSNPDPTPPMTSPPPPLASYTYDPLPTPPPPPVPESPKYTETSYAFGPVAQEPAVIQPCLKPDVSDFPRAIIAGADNPRW